MRRLWNRVWNLLVRPEKTAKVVVVLIYFLLGCFAAYLTTTIPAGNIRFLAATGMALTTALLVRVIGYSALQADISKIVGTNRQKINDLIDKNSGLISKELDLISKGIRKLPLALARSQPAHLGIKQAFAKRSDAVDDIWKRIRTSTKRVWLIGDNLRSDIKLADELHLDELAHRVATKDIAVRLLLSDPYRSPSIFRLMLKEEPELPESLVTHYTLPAQSRSATPLDKTDFGISFDPLLSLLDKKQFHKHVRFYSHLCSWWICLIDNAVYFQPILLDTRARNENGQSGTECPVQMTDKATNQMLFKAIERHIDILWETSTTDLLHMHVRKKNRDDILGDLFQRRKRWLRVVSGFRKHWPQGDKREMRQFPRNECLQKEKPRFRVILAEDAHSAPIDGVLQDYSINSLALVVRSGNSRSFPERGKHANIELLAEGDGPTSSTVQDEVVSGSAFELVRAEPFVSPNSMSVEDAETTLLAFKKIE